VHDRICRLNTIQLAAKQYLHDRLTHVVRFFLHSSRGGFKSTTESKTFECCTRARKLATCCFCPHITLCACSGHQRLIEFVRVRKAPVANERSFFCKVDPSFPRGFLYAACVSTQIDTEVSCQWNLLNSSYTLVGVETA
jgi:hypothetical protein